MLRQGGLRRHRDELRQPGARRARVPVLRLPGRDVRRPGVDRGAARGSPSTASPARRCWRRCARRPSRSPTSTCRGGTAFVGLEPGSMGETSALACLIGAVILIATGIGSWRTMAGVALGTIGDGDRCSTRSARRPTRTSPCRSGGTWSPAAGPSARCSWPPTRSPSPFTERGQVDLRHPDRRVRRADPRRQPGLSRVR